MERITIRNLQNLCAHMNRETGSPLEYCSNKPGERFSANIGHYHIDQAYGGYALDRVMSTGGGVHNVLGRGTARDLYDQMHAWLNGYRAAKSEQSQQAAA